MDMRIHEEYAVKTERNGLFQRNVSSAQLFACPSRLT